MNGSYMNKPIYRVFTFFIILFMAACATGKKPVRKNVKIDKYAITKKYGPTSVDTLPGAAKVIPEKPADNAKKAALIASLTNLWQKDIDFNTFSGKAKMHYKGNGQNQEFTAHIRILKDKIIWVNVVAFGLVNAARVYVTPDSIILLNYLQKEVTKMPIADANKLMPAPVDFQTLQNFIVGNVLQKQGTITDATDFGGTWNLKAENDDIVQQVAYNKADSNMRSLQMRLKQKQTEGMMQYGSYDMVTGRKFANGRVVTINNEGKEYYLDMDFNNAAFDEQLDFPFSIPKSYTLK